MALIESYIYARKAERGLTAKGEIWIRQTLPKFERYISSRNTYIINASRDDIREFLSSINGVWNKHSHFRAIRAFYNWLEREGRIKISPCYRMQAPRTPKKILPRPTIEQVHKLVNSASNARDKAVLLLMMDTGFRRFEIANIKPQDINWDTRTVKVFGKGDKERIGKFSSTTALYLKEHLAGYSPTGNIWGLNYWGIGSVLRRLKQSTGITCNAHSFRRAWAIESIKRGMNLIDVQVLGGWESLEMVKHYAREVNSQDAITRYRPLMEVI